VFDAAELIREKAKNGSRSFAIIKILIAGYMPTLEEWEQALAAPRRVQVESSSNLLEEVRQQHKKKDAKRQQDGQPIPARKNNLTVVPAFSPEKYVEIIPAYMLNRLGVVTTPAIENLADICSTWAYFRYLWAFEILPPNIKKPVLRLSQAARQIDFHQKGLLSDQIGVGMAAVLLGAYLDAPLAADVTVAMDDPTWPIELQYDTSPDYLFFNATQTKLFIVECKGTQTTRASSLDQLRRGTEQVPSLTFTDGRTPPSLVVATCLSKSGTRILVIDPPGEDQPKHLERTERVAQREWRVRNDVEFARGTRLISEAKVLSFAGADEAAASKIEGVRKRIPAMPKIQPRESEIRENEFGTFKGTHQRIGMRDRFNIDLFQALDTTVLEGLISDEPAQIDEQMRTFQNRLSAISAKTKKAQPVSVIHQKGTLIVRTAGPDGSLLEVQVSPP